MWFKIWLSLWVILLGSSCAQQPPTFESPPPSPFPEDPLWTPPPPGSPEPPLNPYAPGKGDESMKRGEVYIDSQEILTLESSPPQYELQVTGSLPTPCHELRAVVEEVDEQNRIYVQVFSLFDPNAVCAQVLEAFDAIIPLGRFASGSYTVFVNGEKVGKIVP